MAQKVRRKAKRGEAPTSDCLLLCDDVLISQGKNKHSLMGVIGGIGVTEFPAVLAGYVAYARFSNVYSGSKVEISLISADTEEPLFKARAEFPAQSDPLGVYTLVIQIKPFRVPAPGRYLFGAYHDGVAIATSPIIIQGLSDSQRAT